MTEYQLRETAALGNTLIETEGGMLMEETGIALAAVTIRTGKARAFANAFSKRYDCPPPDPRSAVTVRRQTIIASALDQVFIRRKGEPAGLMAQLEKDFSQSATVTDQSDGWVQLALTGIRAGDVLERLAMIDCSDQAFPVGSAARTVMEHCGVIIVREKHKPVEGKRYLLFTQRSSAETVLHAILGSPPFRE